jgi:hypothetical protein
MVWICLLFYDAFNVTVYIATNCMMRHELGTGKDLKGSGRGLIEILSLHMPAENKG